MTVPELTVTRRTEADRIVFEIGGRPFTAYVFGDPVAERPYFYPLLGPGGAALTRRFPMETPADGEPTDHPHHRSLWSGQGDMNGHDNWNARPKHGVTRFRQFEESGKDDTLIALSDCLTSEGVLLGHERLEVRILPQSVDSTLIDWQITLTAPADAPLVLGDTKEAGLVAVRVAAPLQGDRGGRIENADGAVGEGACWGKPSRWCDYSGSLSSDQLVIGVALLSHPSSYGHPTHWHVRGYGLFSANPFGLSSFTGGVENGTVHLAPGESLTARYAVLTHPGTATEGNVEAAWKRWAGE